jgi:hypothetical protein
MNRWSGSTRCLQRELAVISQQPGGGDTPGVAAAPVALAGAIIVGLARSIEMASLHAAEFGVGIAVTAGLTLVLPRSVIGGWIVPGDELVKISGVMSGRAAGLVSAFPGADVHEPLGAELPGDSACGTVPVVLPLTDPGINTGIAGGETIDWLALVVTGTVVVVMLSGVVIAAFGLRGEADL